MPAKNWGGSVLFPSTFLSGCGPTGASSCIGAWISAMKDNFLQRSMVLSQICNKAIWKIHQNEGSTVAVVTAWFSFWVDIIWCPCSCRLLLESGEETPPLRLVQWEDVPQAGKTTLQSQHVLVIKFCHKSTNYYVMGGSCITHMVSIVTSCHTTVLGYVEC